MSDRCARRLRCMILALGPILAACSCGPRGTETFAPVAGKATVNEKPLTTGTVTLYPDASRGNKTHHHPVGTIDDQGNYEVYTVGKKGAPPGWYKVVVHADANQQTGTTVAPLPPKWMTHDEYTTESTTPLGLEVVEKPEQGKYDLKLKK